MSLTDQFIRQKLRQGAYRLGGSDLPHARRDGFALTSRNGFSAAGARRRAAAAGLTLIDSLTAGSTNGNGFDTSGDQRNTTGANLIIVALSGINGTAPSISDSRSNSYGTAVKTTNDSFRTQVWLYACYGSVGGTGHYWTVTASNTYSSIAVLAFSGANASPVDTTSGAFAYYSESVASGSLTPSADNSLVVSALTMEVYATASAAALDSFVRIANAGGQHYGVQVGYKIQTTAAAINPTWSWTGVSDSVAAASAAFIP